MVSSRSLTKFIQNANSAAMSGEFGFYTEIPATKSRKIISWGTTRGITFDRWYTGPTELYYATWEFAFKKADNAIGKFTRQHFDYVTCLALRIPCKFPPCDTIGQQLYMITLSRR